MYPLRTRAEANSLQKYDTQIGQRGSRLSGGQKQRVAIARSIISNPKVLLLDEATSALDPKAERIVQEALDNVSRNRTTLVIAHKLSTVRKAQNIAVINKGQVIEQGTHEELIDHDGSYASLVRVQDLGEKNVAEDIDMEKNEKESAMVRTATQLSTASRGGAIDDTDRKMTMNYNLLRCLWILGKEQPELWRTFLLTLVTCVVGGRHTSMERRI
jgi:ATP-binding cassette subfamily B (MDR/TAP) protein 1